MSVMVITIQALLTGKLNNPSERIRNDLERNASTLETVEYTTTKLRDTNMGYSCSARARYTLDQVEFLDEFDIKSPNYKYFIEIGKENADGAITGAVYEITGIPYRDKDNYERRSCRKAGTFRIEPNGSIKRFAGLSKRMFGVLEIAGIEAYDREYARGWNYVYS